MYTAASLVKLGIGLDVAALLPNNFQIWIFQNMFLMMLNFSGNGEQRVDRFVQTEEHIRHTHVYLAAYLSNETTWVVIAASMICLIIVRPSLQSMGNLADSVTI